MVNPRVWVSTTARDVGLGPDGPGAHWQEVGTINTTHEKALWNNVQVHLGLRRSSPRLSTSTSTVLRAALGLSPLGITTLTNPSGSRSIRTATAAGTLSRSSGHVWGRWRAAPLSRTPVGSTDQLRWAHTDAHRN
jgi:hypothetical protein